VPLSYEKRIYRAAVSQSLRNTGPEHSQATFLLYCDRPSFHNHTIQRVHLNLLTFRYQTRRQKILHQMIASIPFCRVSVNVLRLADKFCLHCSIFIYTRHIWIKPVLCSRMVSLFQHISPWTHRWLLSSPSAHRNGRVFRRSVQTACCYWIPNRGKINWNSQTNVSRLWWSVCWCEYSKTLGKAV